MRAWTSQESGLYCKNKLHKRLVSRKHHLRKTGNGYSVFSYFVYVNMLDHLRPRFHQLKQLYGIKPMTSSIPCLLWGEMWFDLKTMALSNWNYLIRTNNFFLASFNFCTSSSHLLPSASDGFLVLILPLYIPLFYACNFIMVKPIQV